MPQIYRRRQNPQSAPLVVKFATHRKRIGAKQFEKNWRHLQKICHDQDSQQRLAWLERQFAKAERGASESAQAEVDIATLLDKCGYSISFVKETDTRTADLECYLGHDRVFVEVTVIVPAESDRAGAAGISCVNHHHAGEEPLDFLKDGVVKRLRARIREKANQLGDYCAPVLLMITIVQQEYMASPHPSKKTRKLALDLQQLGGIMTATLADIPQISGILLTLWNIQPAESRSSIRLRNVHLGEWVPGNHATFSQVRLLAMNPAARYPMEQDARAAIEQVL